MVDIERLTHEALDAVTKEDWENCVRHAEKNVCKTKNSRGKITKSKIKKSKKSNDLKYGYKQIASTN